MRAALSLSLLFLLSFLLSCADASSGGKEDARFGPAPAYAEGTQEVSEPFVGVRILARETMTPRPLRYWVVFIDPSAPGVDFVVTPDNGELPRETTNETTRAFVERMGAQLGVNAHFFSPWPSVDNYSDVLGLSISGGVRYSEPEGAFVESFLVTKGGEASVVRLDEDGEAEGVDWDEVDDAVAGTERVVTAGENTGVWEELHPRTAVGVTERGHVVLFLVDGRQDGVSEGMSTIEMADVLISLGVREAINLDGGGSTSLVVADPEPGLLNRPVGYVLPGTERHNGSNIAVFATPR